MRVRIHLSNGDTVDAEQYSVDGGATWLDITPAAITAALAAGTGYTVVRDALTADWRALRNISIESVGPAGDLSEIIDREVNRRIRELVQHQLPGIVAAGGVIPPPPPPPPAPGGKP
jgi:hypothetical protein